MIKDAKAVLVRADRTLMQDALGAAALVVMLFGALYLPLF